MKKVVVIGSGIGGLAAAIRLASKGYKINVFERNDGPGGKLSFFEQDGYTFDAGPSLFTQPQNIEELFEVAGEPIQDYFTYRKIPISCHYFWEDGKRIKAFTDKRAFAAELQEKLNEHPVTVIEYLKKAEEIYEKIGKIFIDHSLHHKDTWLNKRVIPAIKATRKEYLFQSMHEYHQKIFRSPKTIQLFDRFATYNGSNPYMAPAMLSMIPHLEQNEGTFYPEGGMISITNALYRLALKKGVDFHFNTKVEKILQAKGRVSGVHANGSFAGADIVVSNMDVYYVYRDLLQDERAANEILKRERSSSALIFYWGIKKQFPDLHLHNIFFSKDYEKEFHHLFNDGTMYHDPTIYINITSKMESVHSPLGTENWFVMVNAPAYRDQDWDSMQQEVRTNILGKLKRMMGTDIASLIETERVLNPKGIEYSTLSHMGSLYGTSSNSKWAAFLRHRNDSTKLKGLYFTGGSVHPGGGIPLCLKSAKIVSEQIN